MPQGTHNTTGESLDSFTIFADFASVLPQFHITYIATNTLTPEPDQKPEAVISQSDSDFIHTQPEACKCDFLQWPQYGHYNDL